MEQWHSIKTCVLGKMQLLKMMPAHGLCSETHQVVNQMMGQIVLTLLAQPQAQQRVQPAAQPVVSLLKLRVSHFVKCHLCLLLHTCILVTFISLTIVAVILDDIGVQCNSVSYAVCTQFVKLFDRFYKGRNVRLLC